MTEDLCDFYGLAPKDKIEQSFEFDDSLITDSETDQRIWLQEVAAGVDSGKRAESQSRKVLNVPQYVVQTV